LQVRSEGSLWIKELLHHACVRGAAELGEQAVQVVQAERRLAGRAPRSKRRTFGRDVR